MVISAVFVYGTLMPGQPRWGLLSPWCTGTPPVAAAVSGRLYDTGWGWPPAALDCGERAEVPGLLVQLDPRSVVEALDVLDGVEGVASGLFERTVVVTRCGVHAWAYGWPGGTNSFQRIMGWHESSGAWTR